MLQTVDDVRKGRLWKKETTPVRYVGQRNCGRARKWVVPNMKIDIRAVHIVGRKQHVFPLSPMVKFFIFSFILIMTSFYENFMPKSAIGLPFE